MLGRDFTAMGTTSASQHISHSTSGLITTTDNVSIQRAPLVGNAMRRATLVLVIPWIERRQDLFSYITTCSDLYNAGIPFLLRFHYVITSRNVSQFNQFMKSKSSTSFLALRSLELVSNPNLHGRMGLDAVNSLAEILRSASNLRHVQVTGDLLNRYRALYKALASLPSLRCLDLHGTWGYEPAQLKLLSQLQSPLRVLRMGELEDDLDIILTLANFRRTLEELQLEKTKFCYSPTSLCYPNLTYLHVTSIRNLRLSSFIPAFPNLRTLNFSCLDGFDDEDEDIRDSNIRFQTRHPSQRWFLTSLAGDIESLYTLGLQSEVSVVSVDVTESSLYGAGSKLADACLTPLRPLQLSLQNDDEDIDDASWLKDTIATNCNELVRLSLSFTLTAEDIELPDYLGECLVSDS
ncbi:hypothetical protein EIP86_010692 [Pleurotus ostreatoroseus]|nr:hypothetical protein EIP86_010692 [Pleurotus ostreatoroseus]